MSIETVLYNPETDRWPTIYDYEELENTIKDIANIDNFRQRFYDKKTLTNPIIFGDLIFYENRFPMIDNDGRLAGLSLTSGPYIPNVWLMIGNTCDQYRPMASVPSTLLIPVMNLEQVANYDKQMLETHVKYGYGRTMYLPKNNSVGPYNHMCVDFCLIATVSRMSLQKNARIITRMSRVGALLLHSCIVRFLARDDGRNDSG